MHLRMDWRRVNFDWNRARAFLVTAEEGSLSAAARALGMAQPTLGRQVSALEQELDVALFERTGRGLSLTPSGLELLDHVREMGEAAGRLSLSAAGHSQSLDGNICITAGEAIAALQLPAFVAGLRLAHPGISIEIVASNAPSDLRKREADIAVRSFRPTHSDLVAKKVKDVDGQLFASPQYLARLGNITSPSDLSRAEFIGFDRTDAMINVLSAIGVKLSQDNFTVISESHLTQWELVKYGIGIGVMAADIGDAEPLVQRVHPTLEPVVIPMWLTTHREVNTSRRVRIVFDLLYDYLQDAEFQRPAPNESQ